MQNRLKIGNSVENKCRFTFVMKGRETSMKGGPDNSANNSQSDFNPGHRRVQSNVLDDSLAASIPAHNLSLPKIKQALKQGKYAQFINKQSTAANTVHHSRKPTAYLLDNSTAAENASMLSESNSRRQHKTSTITKAQSTTPCKLF
jgi:hypothetical protein